MKSKLIAPCGMNCGICIGFLREKNKCLGCRGMSENKPEGCRKCIIMHCPTLKKKKLKFCSPKCEKFPCTRLKNLDKRYKNKYRMSMLENLENIEKLGIREFLKREKARWKCKKCGAVLSAHRNFCLKCKKK
jgi:hypothetical protein